MCLVLLLNVLTGLVLDTRWYAANPVLRWQTDAFFRGRTALSLSPYNVPYDTVWDHGVQQVWGLGVPAFRFLFEGLARLLGRPAFPDRITFLIACALCYWFLIRTFIGGETQAANKLAESWKRIRIPWVLALLMFAPPFVALVKARFDVYEEVVAYGYLYSVALFAGFLRVARRPTIGGLLLLGLWAGFGVWIRPTLLFYDIVSVALAGIVAWRARVSAMGILPMFLIFGLAGALLGCSNIKRFGGFFAFGHSLNLESGLDLNTYSLKFGYPFQNERFLSAARDELGTLFFNRKLNGGDFYAPDAVWGQSPTLRWHEMYFTTFNFIYLGLLVASLALWAWHLKRLRTSWADTLATSPAVSREFAAARFDSAFALFAVPWFLISFALLFGFYLWCPSMASRYNVDFLPAVMVGISALVWNSCEVGLLREKAQALEWAILTAVWLVVSIFAAKICRGYDHQSVNLAGIQQPTLGLASKEPPRELRHYEIGQPDPSDGLRFNCGGWDSESGAIEPAATFFCTAPQCVALSLFAPERTSITHDELDAIQAKIGLEYLSRESLTIHSNRAAIVFSGPQRPRYQHGLQVCFLKFIPVEDLGRKMPTLRLAEISFTRTNTTGSILPDAHSGKSL